MFFTIGTPEKLSSIGVEKINISDAKAKVEIAVLDDNPFAPRDALLSHKFRITELGPDIRSLDQIGSYPMIICDVNGVAKAFGSELEGAHLVAEIRKAYPDKYLMAYTGLTYSLSMSNALTAADQRLAKDASVEVWIQTLETGLSAVANPRQRWIRMRNALLERGVELFHVQKLEQAFIKSVQQKRVEIFSDVAKESPVSSEIKDLVIKFSATAVAALVSGALGL
jgi:hypothetical protein